MITGSHFVVTHADGSAAVYAGVSNTDSFRRCMTGLGRNIRPATDADLEASGAAAIMVQHQQRAEAVAAGGRYRAYAGVLIAALPVGANLQ
ncbi:hypothetical protein [Aureimonas psammosilenae]|uniref:hypothetical protein n=1 Tax=Aureimonas psammosilenae TaxID=2495496 RepID=UPI001260BAE6|nr:hypothetical protein [Aureimonas psammosilenae]